MNWVKFQIFYRRAVYLFILLLLNKSLSAGIQLQIVETARTVKAAQFRIAEAT